MIFEAIVTAVLGLVRAIGNLFGIITMPSWWDNIDGWLSSLAGYAAGLGDWIPWTTALGAAEWVAGLFLVTFSIKVIRLVASFFTGGGGSAA